MIRPFTFALALILPSCSIAAEQITTVHEDPVSLYEKNDAGLYVRGAKQPLSELSLPLPVLEHSPRGYVRVSLQGKDVWLDSMDVEIFPPPSIGSSGCVPTLGTSLAAVSRGAGEGCR